MANTKSNWKKKSTNNYANQNCYLNSYVIECGSSPATENTGICVSISIRGGSSLLLLVLLAISLFLHVIDAIVCNRFFPFFFRSFTIAAILSLWRFFSTFFACSTCNDLGLCIRIDLSNLTMASVASMNSQIVLEPKYDKIPCDWPVFSASIKSVGVSIASDSFVSITVFFCEYKFQFAVLLCSSKTVWFSFFFCVEINDFFL